MVVLGTVFICRLWSIWEFFLFLWWAPRKWWLNGKLRVMMFFPTVWVALRIEHHGWFVLVLRNAL
jgi:hypothetical protein